MKHCILNVLGNVCSIVGLVVNLLGSVLRTVKTNLSIKMRVSLLSFSFRFGLEINSDVEDKTSPK